MPRHRFSYSSRLHAAPRRVWEAATDPHGINHELWPLARMTWPRDANLDLATFPIGRRAFRSWILLFGLFPIDYDDITLVRLDRGEGAAGARGFREESPMLTQALWVHERTIVPEGAGCVLQDSLSYEPRIGFLAPIFGVMFRLAFWNRHRRLRARWGGGEAPATT